MYIKDENELQKLLNEFFFLYKNYDIKNINKYHYDNKN